MVYNDDWPVRMEAVCFTLCHVSSGADTQSYVLNFHGRVTQASVKNFQIVHDNDGQQRHSVVNPL